VAPIPACSNAECQVMGSRSTERVCAMQRKVTRFHLESGRLEVSVEAEPNRR
jgi:hypothetical protein